jgi:ribose 5-phosphate isomerase B
VVTERDVRAAAKVGRLVLPAHAIVTPAARELARRLGVALESAERGATSGEHEMGRSQPGAGSRDQQEKTTVAIGADHGGFHLKEALKPAIAELGCGVDVGCYSPDSVDYPVFAAQVADRVACGDAQFGVMIDGAGLGSAMVANKIPGVRAALCYDLTTAQNAREHNNANVLTLGGTLIGERLASETGGRHARRVAMIDALDREPA